MLGRDQEYPQYLNRIDSIIDKWNEKMVQFDDKNHKIKGKEKTGSH